MNNENSILNDTALDEVAGGLNFGSLFGFPAMRKAEIQMRDASLSGLVHGARAEHDRARLASA